MTLPPTPAGRRQRGGRRFAGALLLVLLAATTLSLPGRAQDADPFTATVSVDATADNVIKARDAARIDGQRRALAAVVEQLSPGGAAKLPKLDDKAITDLVASFEVANERMSAVRYMADYTFHFRAAEVRRVLGNAGVALTAEPGKPAVVIPVFLSEGQPRLWDDPNPWREAWEERPSGSGPSRLAVPLGDAGDIAAIDGGKARAGDADALAAIARRNNADDAIVALAAMRGTGDNPSGVDVTVRRYRAGQLLDTHAVPLDAKPGESERDLLRRAAVAVASQIETGWKTAPLAGYDQQGTLTAVLPIGGLDDWVQVRERLAAVPTIRKVTLVALSRQEATIEIGYAGSIDQLKDSLAAIKLDLVRGDPLWRLAHTGPGAAR